MSDASPAESPRVTAATIDHLFRVMAARYGPLWENRWPDGGEDAKRDWLTQLSGTTIDGIVYALRYLPEAFPPTVTQFRATAARAPARRAAVTEQIPADRKRLAAIFRAGLEAMRERAKQPRKWIDELEARRAAGEALTGGQLAALQQAQAAPPPEEPVDVTKLQQQKRETARRVADYMKAHQ